MSGKCWFSLSLLAALALAGCPSSAPDTGSTAQGAGGDAPVAGKKTVAVIPKGLTHDFWLGIDRSAP